MEAIIERLKREKAGAETDWFEQGKLDGLDFAKSAIYVDLKSALAHETIKGMPSNVFAVDIFKNETFGDYYNEMFDNYSEFQLEATHGGHTMPNDLFIEREAGWKEGIEEFWNEIKDKL